MPTIRTPQEALDLGGIRSSARSLPHARFSFVIDLVDQIGETLDAISSDIRRQREPRRYPMRLLHAIAVSEHSRLIQTLSFVKPSTFL
jgi:hypothetical protein